MSNHLGEKIVEGLREAVAFERGEIDATVRQIPHPAAVAEGGGETETLHTPHPDERRRIETTPLTRAERIELLAAYQARPIAFYHVPDRVAVNDNTSRWEATLMEAEYEIERLKSRIATLTHPALAAPGETAVRLAEAVEQVRAVVGCGDHSCLFAKPTFVGTNGGCRCHQRPMVMGRLALLYRAARAQEGRRDV